MIWFNVYFQEHHYRPEGSDTCYPCDCYSVGSTSPSCDMQTGQCDCRLHVIGRRCDMCATKFAEVTIRGCEMQYEDCPRSLHNEVWWERTPLNETAVRACPEGAEGQATRFCDAIDSWREPDYTDCISHEFIKLQEQLKHLEDHSLKINAFVARSLVQQMNTATNRVDKLYLKDLNVTYAIMVHVLSYESSQAGLNLTHKQDKNFIQVSNRDCS